MSELNLTKDGRYFLQPQNDDPMLLSNTDDYVTVPMQGYKTTPCQQDKAGAGYFEVFASTTGTGIGITNMIVIAVILWGGRKLHKATFYCICNLAVADMLAGLLLLWIFGLQKVLLPFRTPESELVQKSIWTVTVWSSMLSQIVIAIDRYCYVTQGARGNGGFSSRGRQNSNKWGNQKRKILIRVGITVTWLIPFLTFVIPVATEWNCVSNCSCQMPINSTTHVYYMVCAPLEKCSQINPPFTKGSMLYLGLSLLVMPTIPCVLYAKIYYFVRTSTKNLKPTYTRPSVSNNNHSSGDIETHPLSKGKTDPDRDHQICSGNGISSTPPSSSSFDDKHAPLPSISDCQHLTPTKNARQVSWRRRVMVTRLFARNPRPVKNSRAQVAHNESIHSNKLMPSSGTFSKPNKGALARNSRRRDMRLLRTLLIILGLFLISTVPLGILFLISYGETDKRYVTAAKILLTASLFNSMVNPWVYFWRFPEMRDAIQKMFCGSCQGSRDRFGRHSREGAQSKRQDGATAGGAHDSIVRVTRKATRSEALKDMTSSSNSAL